MNTDDPKFTAHVLGEIEDLTPEERAEIEAFLAGDSAAAGEAAETKAFAAHLRAEFVGEETTLLRNEQRVAVFEALADEGAKRKIARFPRRTATLAAIAACFIVAVSDALLYWGMQREELATRKVLATAHPAPDNEAASAPTVQIDSLNPQLSAVPPALASMPNPFAATPRPLVTLTSIPPSTTGSAFAGSLCNPTSLIASNGPILAQGSAATMTMPVWKPLQPALSAVNPGVETVETLSPPVAAVPLQTPSILPAATGTARIPAGNEYQRYPGHPGTTSLGAPASSAPIIMDSDFDTGIGRFPATPYTVGAAPNGGRVNVSSLKYILVPPTGAEPVDTAAYGAVRENDFLGVRESPLSTFSIDVDTAGYSIVRRFLNDGQLPPKEAVRIEELLNYFSYDYPQPKGETPFSATMEVAGCPWQPEHRLVRIGLKGREMAKEHRPPSNLVFLIDVSGSMDMPNKLPLLKQCFGLLIDQLGPEDQVSIVTYAGESGCALEPTHDKQKMREAMRQLEAGGGTNGSSGVQMAYEIAQKSFIKGGTNRVILATDGDWNVGVTNENDLLAMIAGKAKTGVFLTALGFGVDNLKDTMLVKLADRGNGHYAYIDTLLEAKKVFVEQLTDTLVNIAKDVKIQVEFNPAQVVSYRLIGYEKRTLAKEDFNDDRKDAGEIGAGHTVTALYEIVPAGKEPPAPRVDALKYQPQPTAETATPPEPPKGEASKELLTLKLRYKAPDGDTSKLLEFPLIDAGATWEKSSPDFRFAAAVAGYGMLLRDSPYKGNANWKFVAELGREGLGADASGYRAEFLSLVEKARECSKGGSN